MVCHSFQELKPTPDMVVRSAEDVLWHSTALGHIRNLNQLERALHTAGAKLETHNRRSETYRVLRYLLS